MVKIKATINGKQKRSEELEVTDRADLIGKLEQVFNVDPGSIIIMKPNAKDQAGFEKFVKDGSEVLFKANEKKQLTEDEKRKMKEKEEQMAVELEKAVEKAKKFVEEQLTVDEHARMCEKLTNQGIKQRGFSYLNQTGSIENLHTDHYTSPVHLLRIVPEFKKFCINYKVQPKNPDGLLISELGKNFQLIEGLENDKIIDPLDWCSSFIAYCADDINYPYPTYDMNYIIHKIFTTVQTAHITEAERREPNATPSSLGTGNTPFALEVNIKKTKKTKLDDDDFEYNKQVSKKDLRYVLECDISEMGENTYEKGIRKRFGTKTVWQNFYAFDIEYDETIIDIERPPKYLFVHTNRIGYPPNLDQSHEIVLLPNPKSTHQVRTKRILDLTEFCSNALKDRLQNGKFQRYQLFYRLAEEQGYTKFLQDLRKKSGDINITSQYTENELKYMYWDTKLLDNDIFHEYYFDQLKGSKQTGEYRIIGVIFHKGKYYHHPEPDHTKLEKHPHSKEDCRGQFMVMVYKQGNQWLKFHDANVEKVTFDEVLSEKYWGGGEFTPALCLYREIYIKNIEIEVPQE